MQIGYKISLLILREGSIEKAIYKSHKILTEENFDSFFKIKQNILERDFLLMVIKHLG